MEYSLTNGKYTAAVTTTGGELISFKDETGREHLWQGDPAIWTGRNPILFPAIGALKGGGAMFDGVFYPLSRHGFVRGREFSLAERGGDWAVLEISESPDTLAQYPYPFRLRVRHALTETGFKTSFTVKNTGERPMPYCIGGHTAYLCPMYEGETFEDYSLVFDEKEDTGSIAVAAGGLLARRYLDVPRLRGEDTIDLRHEFFDGADTLIFDGLKSKAVTLMNRKTRKGTRVTFGDFPMLGIWTMPNKQGPYLCIEPWQGCAGYEDESGAFLDKAHCVVLAPGEERTHSFSADMI